MCCLRPHEKTCYPVLKLEFMFNVWCVLVGCLLCVTCASVSCDLCVDVGVCCLLFVFGGLCVFMFP